MSHCHYRGSKWTIKGLGFRMQGLGVLGYQMTITGECRGLFSSLI